MISETGTIEDWNEGDTQAAAPSLNGRCARDGDLAFVRAHDERIVLSRRGNVKLQVGGAEERGASYLRRNYHFTEYPEEAGHKQTERDPKFFLDRQVRALKMFLSASPTFDADKSRLI